MIKVGIIGADTPCAGELLRGLVLHPEIELSSLYAPHLSGRMVSGIHFGFYGEEIPDFTDHIDLQKLNIVFIAEDSPFAKEILSRSEEWPELRIVDLSPSRIETMDAFGLEYGLSEINRKPLVRGARMAAVPTPAASVSLISLYPFIVNSLLPGNFSLKAELPCDVADVTEGLQLLKEITSILKKFSPDSKFNPDIEVQRVNSRRAMRVTLEFDCRISLPESANLFDQIYDDHNFTFFSFDEVDPEEVEGTHKCIVSCSKPSSERIKLTATADSRFRGGAGDALHLLNLFFALDEKVGLRMKPYVYGTKENKDGRQQSWFA